MTAADLVRDLPLLSPLPPDWASIEVQGLEYDSRLVSPDCFFFAFPGAKADGRAFARQAVDRGAVAVISELPPLEGFNGRWIQVPHGRRALSIMSRRLYGAPDDSLRVTGVTGTNGKTTIVYLIDAMLRGAGFTTGMVGTVVYRVGAAESAAVNTTPESLDLFRMMSESLRTGGTHFTFEVSSHALDLGRVYGIRFHTAVFSNLSIDHLDYHGTMENYFAAKQRLFDGAGGPPPKYAVLNADDEYGRHISLDASTIQIRYSLEGSADIRATAIDAGFHGLRFDVQHPGGRTHIESKLCGLFNIYNLLAAFGAGLSLGIEPEAAANGLGALEAVPGRFERIDEGQPFLAVVDYAHTSDALANTIAAARALDPRRIITVFGCGGDRDRSKRPLMGEAAASLSDYVVVTSDNPRSEDPLAIINDALVGVRRRDTPHFVEPDREKAIRHAIGEAGPDDFVLIAGKGHETYQVLGDRTIGFDDREVVRRILRGYGYRPKEARP